MPAVEIPFNPLGAHVRQTSLGSVYTPAPPSGAGMCVVQALGANVRFTLDGTDPSATFGFQLATGDVERVLPIGSATVLKFIQEAAGAEVQLQFGNKGAAN